MVLTVAVLPFGFATTKKMTNPAPIAITTIRMAVRIQMRLHLLDSSSPALADSFASRVEDSGRADGGVVVCFGGGEANADGSGGGDEANSV